MWRRLAYSGQKSRSRRAEFSGRNGCGTATRGRAAGSEVDSREIGSHNEVERREGWRTTDLKRNEQHSVRPPARHETSMSQPSSSSSCKHWLPVFDQLLDTVRGCGPHGQLVDVSESLRSVLGPTRPLVMLCPHADDGAITAACLLHEYAVRRGLPVIEVLVFAGERNVAAPWLDNQKEGQRSRGRVSTREQRSGRRGNLLGPRRLPHARL